MLPASQKAIRSALASWPDGLFTSQLMILAHVDYETVTQAAEQGIIVANGTTPVKWTLPRKGRS